MRRRRPPRKPRRRRSDSSVIVRSKKESSPPDSSSSSISSSVHFLPSPPRLLLHRSFIHHAFFDKNRHHRALVAAAAARVLHRRRRDAIYSAIGFSQVKTSKSVRPKCPYAAVCWYRLFAPDVLDAERLRSRSRPTGPGRKSIAAFTLARISSSGMVPVPYVSTNTESGSGTPMAYDSCTMQRFASPAATTDLAACLEMYAAERSTFVGSFPEKAPPPCAPQPP
mmetsp:Transcript_2880/g.9379  ORF Transcript_2880/g.9379 Transcript_2880/m.9379 type:complete len:224 (+) Transcript_2880:272-943(+)